MNISRTVRIILICSFIIPAHAMESEKEGRPSLCNRITATIGVLLLATTFLTTGLKTHLDLVNEARTERDNCFAIRGFHPEHGNFKVLYPICNAQENAPKMHGIIKEILGEGVALQAQLTACESYERHQGPVKQVTITCIDRPEEMTSDHITVSKTKKQKNKGHA